MLEDLKIQCECPMKLFCNHKSAISFAYNLVQHDKIKHIGVDQHFIKEKLDNVLITNTYIPYGHQLVDVLTKCLLIKQFNQLTCKIGMIISIHQVEWEC